MNTVIIMGNLGADPETRVTPSGQKVTTLRVAGNIYQNGKDETIWWRVTVWGDDFKKIMDHLKKGSSVIVTGEMRAKPEVYNDKEGRPQVSLNITATSIRFSPFGKSDRSGQEPQQRASAYQASGSESKEPGFLASGSTFGGSAQYAETTQDDEIPF